MSTDTQNIRLYRIGACPLTFSRQNWEEHMFCKGQYTIPLHLGGLTERLRQDTHQQINTMQARYIRMTVHYVVGSSVRQ